MVKPKLSDGPATVEQVIGWAMELLELQSDVGLGTDWPSDYLTRNFSIVADPPTTARAPVTLDRDLMTALGSAIADHTREKWLSKTLSRHTSMYHKAVPDALNDQARALGLMDEAFAVLGVKAKLIRVMEAKLPPRMPKATFKVYLITAVDGHQDGDSALSELYLPLAASFVDLQATLRDRTAYSARLHGHDGGYSLQDGPFKYHLVSKDNTVVGDRPGELANTAQFEKMVRLLRRSDTPCAAIWHVCASDLVEPDSTR
ncbi:MAG: hypothetical protein M1838_001309 [Thelocarpon superellum]|nr:MAG: hypothetical protein M1838_001309 [Thelocarpon superellum]